MNEKIFIAQLVFAGILTKALFELLIEFEKTYSKNCRDSSDRESLLFEQLIKSGMSVALAVLIMKMISSK
tara:strand:- start:61 stop:270 length:210 start_codon:yes stop_codon:yes gene_type:complete